MGKHKAAPKRSNTRKYVPYAKRPDSAMPKCIRDGLRKNPYHAYHVTMGL